jgi:hypothetical protein
MGFLRSGVTAIVFIGLGGVSLQGQSRPAHVIVAPQGRARIARIAPPPPPPAQPLTTYGETIFASYPAILTADGRVLVNLGNGYEQVARTCPYAYGYGCESYGYPIAPLTPIPQSYAPPTYVAPRYAPPAYGAPVYPVPTYQPAAIGVYGNYPVMTQPGYVPPSPPTYRPPQSNYGGCPPGYVPTGSYPPCVDPSRTPVNTPQVQLPTATARAAPRSATQPSATTARGAIRR